MACLAEKFHTGVAGGNAVEGHGAGAAGGLCGKGDKAVGKIRFSVSE